MFKKAESHRWTGFLPGRRQPEKQGHAMLRRWGLLLTGAGCGAGLMYYVDPDRGRRRRKVTADRSLAVIRQANRRMMRAERRAAAQIAGKATELRHFRQPPDDVANDQMLTDRILSQAFRDFDFPHGQVNINVEDRVAVLRGTLTEPEAINRLESAVRKTPGVIRVESYLHLPNTSAPPEGARH
jgi:hyperosmotically inducible periplasmic protein